MQTPDAALEARFRYNYSSFLDEAPAEYIRDQGPTPEQLAERQQQEADWVIACLATIAEDEPGDLPPHPFAPTHPVCTDTADLPEKLYDEPAYRRPYDRAVAARVEVEEKLATDPDDLILIRRLADLQERERKELKREESDTWRTRYEINEWRATDGRETRNAGRRKVRAEPNSNLSKMSPEEKRAHKNAQAAERMRRMRAKQKDSRIANKSE